MDKRIYRASELDTNRTGWIADLSSGDVVNYRSHWAFATKAEAKLFLELVDAGTAKDEAVELVTNSPQALAARLGSIRSAKKAASSRANLPQRPSPYEEYLHEWTDDAGKTWYAVARWVQEQGEYQRPLTPAERRAAGAGMFGTMSRNVQTMGKFTRSQALRRARLLYGPK